MTKYTNDKRTLPFGHSAAISDPDVDTYLQNLNLDLTGVLSDTTVVDRFCDSYRQWLVTSTNHTLRGIEDFKYATYSQGTSESFDKFYMKHRTRRFRVFKTEYMYHQLAWRNSWPDWKYIEDNSLDSNDAVVISIPFADTGDRHHSHEDILSECDRLGIPVLIDCAYFSISSGIDIDLTHPCITTVTFSLSKTFPVAHARVGLRLTREDDDDTLFVYQKSFYNNRIGAAIGLALVENFSPRYIVDKYKLKQQEFCRLLNVTPSKTVLFGIATEQWSEYNRGGSTNRLSLHKYLHSDVDTLLSIINHIHTTKGK